MELKEKLKKIMEQEYGIVSDDQLNDAFNKMDTSDFGIFTATRKGKENEI